MTAHTSRQHLVVSATTPRELGRVRGEALRASLGAAVAGYRGLFRALGISPDQEQAGAEASLEAVAAWRPDMLLELEGIAAGARIPLGQVAALNARTEILAFAERPSPECSTVTSVIAGERCGVQTWDWHVEFDDFWHTHEVDGPGYRFVGLTEQGIVSKIGMNETGLGLHVNILGHGEDRPGGVPVHVLSKVVLAECATVGEALALVRDAPITSSSAFTLLDTSRAVSVEMSPVGVFDISEINGSVQRTNHFQHPSPGAGQKSELHEPESSDRLRLIRNRLAAHPPGSRTELVELLESGPGEPPLTCVPDPARSFGERWATLATVVSQPGTRQLHVFDGMPPAARTGQWRSMLAVPRRG